MSDDQLPADGNAKVTQLVDEIVAAMINVRIYAIAHPRCQSSLSAVKRLVGEVATASGESPVRIACADDLLVFQRRPLLAASLAASRLISTLRQWGSGGVELSPGVTVEELTELLTGIGARPAAGDRPRPRDWPADGPPSVRYNGSNRRFGGLLRRRLG